jgi:hypothetical protein
VTNFVISGTPETNTTLVLTTDGIRASKVLNDETIYKNSEEVFVSLRSVFLAKNWEKQAAQSALPSIHNQPAPSCKDYPTGATCSVEQQ